jgi:predicted AAA+ superfamily ATPase
MSPLILEKLFREYLTAGGFHETQGLDPRDRLPLLQSYVDAVIFRDVIERHGVTNVVALRRLIHHLLGGAAGLFSVHRFLGDLRSQDVTVAKDTLHVLLAHLEAAFLVRLAPIATGSERQRQSNFPDRHQTLGLGVRQRLEQHRVNDAEDRGVRADPQRQRDDGDQCEARLF